MRGIALTQSTMGLVRQALKRFGLIGAGALGLERLGQGCRGRNRHRPLGLGEVQYNEEPNECKQGELIDTMMRHHGVAPSKTG